MTESNILLVTSVLLGGTLAFFLESRKEWWETWRPMIISFGGAFLLGITVMVIFPDVFGSNSNRGGISLSYYVLIGFLIQIILETISGGIEHGHVHSHQHEHGLSIGKAVTVMLGLSLHSVLEGMPITGLSHHAAHQHSYVWGIFVHKFPAAFALMAFLLDSRLSKLKVWIILIIFSLMTPLGSALGSFLMDYGFSTDIYPILLALVAGSFLHIATIVLFEFNDVEGHQFSYKRLVLILLGLLLAGVI